MSTSCLENMSIVLPSLNPDEKFSKVVAGLVDRGFKNILIVDDGSCEEKQIFFSEAEKYDSVTVLHHGINKGKGRALKTAFEYISQNRPELAGVITIDGDGQHLIDDIIACGDKMLELKDKVVLGCRDFDLPHVPPKSRVGNKITSFMFLFACGIKLSDTQTGLRAIPQSLLPSFCTINGERFDYETNMLLMMKRWGVKFEEVKIETVYEDENAGTHFRPIADSLKIFKIMFKFILSSLGSTLVDIVLFYLLFKFAGPFFGKYATLASTAIARACSAVVNYLTNRNIVFHSSGSYKSTAAKYVALAIPQMLLSAGLVSLLNSLLNNTVPILATVLKICVDFVLFIVSYNIQREWVFKK